MNHIILYSQYFIYQYLIIVFDYLLINYFLKLASIMESRGNSSLPSLYQKSSYSLKIPSNYPTTISKMELDVREGQTKHARTIN